ncbi:hypothetical protein L2E82_50832 [Cichorium intybus]|nr:hypothetical protein L2E82_50832 [Cichorium intybus]
MQESDQASFLRCLQKAGSERKFDRDEGCLTGKRSSREREVGLAAHSVCNGVRAEEYKPGLYPAAWILEATSTTEEKGVRKESTRLNQELPHFLGTAMAATGLVPIKTQVQTSTTYNASKVKIHHKSIMSVRNMGVSGTPLVVGGGEDGVDKDESSDDLGA